MGLRVCKIDGCGGEHEAKGLCQNHYIKSWRENTPQCSIDGCDNRVAARGLCGKHYSRYKRHNDPLAVKLVVNKDRPTICVVDGCDKPHKAKGFCRKHYNHQKKHGYPVSKKVLGRGAFWERIKAGDQYGFWTVLGDGEPIVYGPGGGGRPAIKCRCACGTIGNVRMDSIKDASKRDRARASCGCRGLSLERGKKYGKLTILSLFSPLPRRKSSWNIKATAQCDCGNIVEREFRDLKNWEGRKAREAKYPPSCDDWVCKSGWPTLPKESWLTIVGFSHIGARSVHFWVVKCKCGNVTIKSVQNIANGSVISCGCARKDKSGAHRKDRYVSESNRKSATRRSKGGECGNKDLIKLHYEWARWYTENTGIQHEVDHYWPLDGRKASGLHTENNLIILDRTTNRSKNNKNPIRFFGRDLFEEVNANH